MEKRLPKGGALVKAYSYGHILHPVYRGLILSDLNLTTDTLELFVTDNETAEEENEFQEDALNQGVVEIDIDDEDNYIFATFKQSQQQQTQAPSQSLLTPQTPLQAEVARYMSNRNIADRPDAGIQTFDILGWWSEHEKIFPLLSKAAKKYLAIQATSCASERPSLLVEPPTVSCKRTKLDPTNVHYLVYCKENLPKIKLTRPRLEDDEERDLEEQCQQEEEPPVEEE